ncbi:Uncharacterised protein [Arthrobacter agilis]|uniref:DUF6318 family protein n=1 Tax=Arthrobacter agilis TaxID=37921 RepID=UPI000F6CE260|nr:DUF6318 family protein [Arthrobacter agilis]VDR31574.1 Uncharacterised protein [Arthrobacter agilis]
MRQSGRRPKLGRSASLVAGAAVALAVLTACQGDPDPSASETSAVPTPSAASSSVPSSSSATPEPSPASSLGPAAHLPVPVKPALADENSAEGLEAFTEYWFELFSYGYETNDWLIYDELTDAGCRTCANLSGQVRQLYAEEGWIEGGNVDLISHDTEFTENTSGSVNSFVDVQQDELIYYDSNGQEINRSEALPPTINVTIALWEEGSWIMLDFGSPEGA